MSILRPKRNERLDSFHIKTNFLTVFLLFALFVAGCLISLRLDLPGLISYVLLWGLSYFILFAGACKNCVYYGRTCPVPLEGSCVHYLFKPGKDRFGYGALFWATIAYALRICIPMYLIFSQRLITAGAVYLTVLSAFWITHLRFTGCPNCINYQCPLNPEQEK